MVRLFVCREIENKIEAGIKAMEENIALFNEYSMKAQYIYIYSLFESTLTETLRYYLAGFPEKIGKNITISKESLFSSPLTSIVISDVINTYIRGYSSDSLVKYIEFYLNTIAIVIDIDVKRIQKIANERNKIVHDTFRSSYSFHNAEQKGIEKIECDILKSDVLYLKALLSEIDIAVNRKYCKYTLEKVCRAIWSKTFSTSLLKFDDVWEIKKSSIHIRDFDKVYKKYYGLSKGEKVLFAIFLQQYSDSLNEQIFRFRDMAPICSLDQESREKMINILQLFVAHPYLFNGEKLD